MNKPSLIFQGPVFARAGYGAHCRDILKSLHKMDKYDIKIIPMRWGNTPQNQTEADTEFGQWMLSSVLTGNAEQPDIFMQCSVANEFEPKGKFNIGVTAGVETTVAPLNFIEGCNKMQLVIVPSEFTKSVLVSTIYHQRDEAGNIIKEFKITTPVVTLFEGVEQDIYDKVVNKNILDDIPESFVFLAVGHWLRGDLSHDRKDIGMTIKTFATVFQSVPKENRPALVLKTSSAGFSMIERDAIQNKINDVLKPFGDNCPSVYLVYGDLTDSDMSSLYHHPKVKAMVSFTKGEGYGRPLAEFTLTGKPILASNWSAHTEFLPKENAVLLEGSLTNVHESAADQFLMKEAQWFSVNYSIAGSKMYDVFKNYNTYLEKSKGLRTNTLKNFTLDKMHELFTKIMTDNVKIQPKIVPFTLPKLTKIQ